MARTVTFVGLGSLLLSLTAAQKPGPGPEVHPKLQTWKCTKAGGCKEQTNYLVLDSLAHPVHQVDSWESCGNWGSPPNATACPTQEACAENCIMDGIADYSEYGVVTEGASLTMRQLVDGQLKSPRLYLLEENKENYEMLKLTGGEFAFDVDVTKLPCGMNSALYLSEMAADGARSKLNPGGATYGTGYCDAQCFVTPFINGLGNVEGKGSCCNEMDIWESNSRASHIAPHPCNQTGLYLCEGEECKFEGVCDKNGCAWNPYRVDQDNYYGRGDNFKVDTTRPFTVLTRFPANEQGKLKEIHRIYLQDNEVIRADVVSVPGLPAVSYLNDEFCAATGSRRFTELGGMEEMGDAMTRGMVLAISIWWDEGGNMTWLDSGDAGPCNSTEGNPSVITIVEPDPTVVLSNLKWGEIGSTVTNCKKLKH